MDAPIIGFVLPTGALLKDDEMNSVLPGNVCRVRRHMSCGFALLLLTLVLLPSLLYAADRMKPDDQQAFVVNDYRYDPGTSGGDPDTGHALCGTQCNAMSYDYRNVIDPGGWRFIRVAKDRELTIPLNNPFMGGDCICTADEYVIKINDFDRPKQ